MVGIVDGDTIDVGEGPERIRLLGVDAPEIYYEGHEDCSSADDIECCHGSEASDWLTEIISPGTLVQMSFDLDCEDTFGRTLAYLWIEAEEDTATEPVLVNELLIQEGYARVYEVDIAHAQDIRYLDRFRDAQTEAQEDGLGLWSACY